jgi:hypothetical protein
MGLFRVGAVERRSRLGIRDAQKRRGHLKGLDDRARLMRRENVCESVTPQVSPGRHGTTRHPPTTIVNVQHEPKRDTGKSRHLFWGPVVPTPTSEVHVGGECDGQRQNGVQPVARPIQPVGETWLVR